MRHDGSIARWVSRVAMPVLLAVLAVGAPATVAAQSEAVYATVPIEIRPDAVYVDWTVRRIDPAVGCTAAAWIRREGGPQARATVYDVSLSGAGDEVKAGQTPLGDGPGSYLLDLGGSGCTWTINVVAR
jgi:hypothetical protein